MTKLLADSSLLDGYQNTKTQMRDTQNKYLEDTMFETNQNKPERILRFLIAALLLPAPFLLEQTVYTLAMAGVGAILLFNALSGACMTYKAFGVNTCSLPESQD